MGLVNVPREFTYLYVRLLTPFHISEYLHCASGSRVSLVPQLLFSS